jgi:hypothetical protein
MSDINPDEAAIADAIAAFPLAVRSRMLALRTMIREVADATPGVGPLTETLKWGQPAFLTSATGSGTTLCLGTDKNAPEQVKLYVPCQTDLIEQFRTHYADNLNYSGKRAVTPGDLGPSEEAALRHCIALALTYQARRKTRSR